MAHSLADPNYYTIQYLRESVLNCLCDFHYFGVTIPGPILRQMHLHDGKTLQYKGIWTFTLPILSNLCQVGVPLAVPGPSTGPRPSQLSQKLKNESRV